MNKQKETKNEDPREKYKKEIEELFRMHGDDDAFVLNELSKKKNHEFTEAYLDKKRKIKNQFINQIEWILFNTEMSTESKRQHLLELKKDGVYKHFGYDIDLYYNRLGKKLIDRLRSQVSTRDYVSDMTDLKVLMNNAKTKEEKEKILYDYFEHLPNRGQVSLMNAFETGEWFYFSDLLLGNKYWFWSHASIRDHHAVVSGPINENVIDESVLHGMVHVRHGTEHGLDRAEVAVG